MNMKKIVMFALAITLVGGSSLFVHASQNNDASTKNRVVTTQSHQTNKGNITNGTISDEKAVQMATEAMKNYMGIDASSFSGTVIERQEDLYNKKMQEEPARNKYQKEHPEQMAAEKKFLEEHPEKAKEYLESVKKSQEKAKHADDTIMVYFTRVGNNKCSGDFVQIDETTGEILNVTSLHDFNPKLDGKLDDMKVKNVALGFLKKMGKDVDVDLNSISINNDNGALSRVEFKLKGGTSKEEIISLEVNLQNYTIVHYQNYSNTFNK